MKLRRHGWLARAFFGASKFAGGQAKRRAEAIECGYEQANLCEVMCRVFVWMPLLVVLTASAVVLAGAFVIIAVSFIVLEVWYAWLRFMALSEMAATVAAIALAVLVLIAGRRVGLSETAQAVDAWIIAKKRRVCPLVTFTEDDA